MRRGKRPATAQWTTRASKNEIECDRWMSIARRIIGGEPFDLSARRPSVDPELPGRGDEELLENSSGEHGPSRADEVSQEGSRPLPFRPGIQIVRVDQDTGVDEDSLAYVRPA